VAVVIELGEIVDVTCSFAVHTVHLYFFFIDPCLCCQKNYDCSGLSISLSLDKNSLQW